MSLSFCDRHHHSPSYIYRAIAFDSIAKGGLPDKAKLILIFFLSFSSAAGKNRFCKIVESRPAENLRLTRMCPELMTSILPHKKSSTSVLMRKVRKCRLLHQADGEELFARLNLTAAKFRRTAADIGFEFFFAEFFAPQAVQIAIGINDTGFSTFKCRFRSLTGEQFVNFHSVSAR